MIFIDNHFAADGASRPDFDDDDMSFGSYIEEHSTCCCRERGEGELCAEGVGIGGYRVAMKSHEGTAYCCSPSDEEVGRCPAAALPVGELSMLFNKLTCERRVGVVSTTRTVEVYDGSYYTLQALPAGPWIPASRLSCCCKEYQTSCTRGNEEDVFKLMVHKNGRKYCCKPREHRTGGCDFFSYKYSMHIGGISERFNPSFCKKLDEPEESLLPSFELRRVTSASGAEEEAHVDVSERFDGLEARTINGQRWRCCCSLNTRDNDVHCTLSFADAERCTAKFGSGSWPWLDLETYRNHWKRASGFDLDLQTAGKCWVARSDASLLEAQ
eukprot:TRINITY_DN14747_c0_g2_i2.p1 TRINITY_DN14747_c0_g2~~TRINITY_DN14747_c0_g2_i2.p1  ORF type:complete len:327 (-),score=44.62 TRINITY_DN14747_c0_g2_i2:40-1020(-)